MIKLNKDLILIKIKKMTFFCKKDFENLGNEYIELIKKWKELNVDSIITNSKKHLLDLANRAQKQWFHNTSKTIEKKLEKIL